MHCLPVFVDVPAARCCDLSQACYIVRAEVNSESHTRVPHPKQYHVTYGNCHLRWQAGHIASEIYLEHLKNV